MRDVTVQVAQGNFGGEAAGPSAAAAAKNAEPQHQLEQQLESFGKVDRQSLFCCLLFA